MLKANTGCAQALTSSAGFSAGIAHGSDDAAHLGLDQRIDARWRSPVMRAWLERHVDGRAGGVDSQQCAHLGVRPAGFLVPALTDDLAAARDDAADARVGCGGEKAALGKRERAAHHRLVKRAEISL